MIAYYRKIAAKYDALSIRERVMVFGGVLVVAAALLDVILLQPLAAQQKRATQQLADARNNVRTSDAAIRILENQDAATTNRKYREELLRQIAEIDSKMRGLHRNLVPPEQMAKLLEGMLGRSRGLTLVALKKLPVQRFDVPGQPAPPKDAAPAAERGIFQHSFEFSIQGSYADLHDYLVRLEKLPWQMFWGHAKLSADEHPKLTLTLTVHTLSLNKAWLIV